MTLYLDTSSLVKLYVDEPGSDAVHRLVGTATAVATSSIAYTETRAALTRRRRERDALRTFETIVDLIGHTSTATGLRVRSWTSAGTALASRSPGRMPPLHRHHFHGDSNYEIHPRAT